jgi:hypothetical protein
VLRFEAPLPRGGPPACATPGGPSGPGFSALQWLQGQHAPLRATLHTVYFRGRHSTAPDTPAAAAAEAAAAGGGRGAVAGLGAAWLWQGVGRAAGRCDAGVVAGLARFLAEDQPRLRVLGGARCGDGGGGGGSALRAARRAGARSACTGWGRGRQAPSAPAQACFRCV